MKTENKKIVTKIIYAFLFIAMIVAFVYLSEKYASNSVPKVSVIQDFYSEIKSNKFEVIRGKKFISLIKTGKNVVFVGNSNSEYSQKYIYELETIINELDIDKIYYYDINNDKTQQNSNYYKIRELLNGYLTTTDNSQNNLFAPSLYIIDEGKVKYYNTETVATKNTETVDDYWTKEAEEKFNKEISEAIKKYYLNNN